MVIDGHFKQYSEWHQAFFAFRCSFISGTYAILHSHFLYRFLVLFNNQLLAEHFVPFGIVLTVLYCAFHQAFWVVMCWQYIGADYARRLYIRDSLLAEHGWDSMNLTLIVAQYKEGPYESIKKSWIGIGSMSILSIISLIILFFLGYKIVRKLSSQTLEMSEKTRKLQTQLMKALAIQAAIPTLVSFSPCLFAWYQPVFGLNLGRWVGHSAGIAVATFPCLDPLALIYFVPTFRKRFLELLLSWTGRNRTRCSQHLAQSTSQSVIEK